MARVPTTLKTVSTRKVEKVVTEDVAIKAIVIELDAANAAKQYIINGKSNGTSTGIYYSLDDMIREHLPEDFMIRDYDNFYQYEQTEGYRTILRAFKKVLGEV